MDLHQKCQEEITAFDRATKLHGVYCTYLRVVMQSLPIFNLMTNISSYCDFHFTAFQSRRNVPYYRMLLIPTISYHGEQRYLANVSKTFYSSETLLICQLLSQAQSNIVDCISLYYRKSPTKYLHYYFWVSPEEANINGGGSLETKIISRHAIWCVTSCSTITKLYSMCYYYYCLEFNCK